VGHAEKGGAHAPVRCRREDHAAGLSAGFADGRHTGRARSGLLLSGRGIAGGAAWHRNAPGRGVRSATYPEIARVVGYGAPETVERLRAILLAYEPQPVSLVPTHGDWQPRNWLVDGEVLRAIDFGRADWRPASTDFARLAVRQFAADPALEAAFLEGYGPDPRTPELWRLLLVREAIGTAVWAYMVGDEEFEMEGHRMFADVLTEELGTGS
jgi:hypothetical protein